MFGKECQKDPLLLDCVYRHVSAREIPAVCCKTKPYSLKSPMFHSVTPNKAILYKKKALFTLHRSMINLYF